MGSLPLRTGFGEKMETEIYWSGKQSSFSAEITLKTIAGRKIILVMRAERSPRQRRQHVQGKRRQCLQGTRTSPALLENRQQRWRTSTYVTETKTEIFIRNAIGRI